MTLPPARRRTPLPAARATGLAVGLLLLLGTLAGCGLVRGKIDRLFGGKFLVDVTVAQGLNGDAPVAVELVVPYDASLLPTLQAMTARQWFTEREQFYRDHPGATDHWHFEWIPGQQVEALHLSYRVGAAGGVVFASYFSPGAHREAFDPHDTRFALALGRTGFTLTKP